MRCYNSSHERRGDENTVIVKLISHLMLYILLTVAAIGDFKNYRISNRLILTGLGCAFLFRLVGGKVASIIWFLPDIVFPVVIFIFLISFRHFRSWGYQVIFSSMCIYKFKIYRLVHGSRFCGGSGIWSHKYGA